MRKTQSCELLLVLAWLVQPALAAADFHRIDPTQPPAQLLSDAELARVRALEGTVSPLLGGDVSPDGLVVPYLDAVHGPVLLDVRTGAMTPIAPELAAYVPWLLAANLPLRWRDAQTLVGLGRDPSGAASFVLIAVDRRGSGNVSPLVLPGAPISISSTGRKLLLQRPAAEADGEVDFLVYDLETRVEQLVLSLPPDVGLGGVAWSPDDERLALVRRKWLTGRVEGVQGLEVLDALGRLPPEQNPLFTSSALDLYRLDRPRPTHIELRPRPGALEIFASVAWSPDGRMVMAQMLRGGQRQGRPHPSFGFPDESRWAFYGADGRPAGRLERPEVSAVSPTEFLFLSPHQVVIAAPWRLAVALHLYDLRDGRLSRLAVPEGTASQLRAIPNAGELLFAFESFQDPPEIVRAGLGSAAPTRLTDLNAGARAAAQLRVDPVQFRLASGAVREGRLIQPAGAPFPPRDAPTVVFQYGGPTTGMVSFWGARAEQPFALLPSFGISVLFVPLPGRTQLGPAFLDALEDGDHFGQIDVDEQAEIARQLLAWGYTSRDRLGIAGCSYGGYFAAQSITRHPDLYAAANPQCSLLDLSYEWSSINSSFAAFLEGRALEEDPEEYQRDSPLFQASRVRTPTLLFTGSDDFLPWRLSVQFHDGIQAAGTATEVYLFEGEGHVMAQPNSLLAAAQLQIEWFRRFLARD
jgi:dipeptidyl aminopeptidase/acylaminoacyl peptidase